MIVALLHGFAGDPAVWDDVIAAWPTTRPPLRAIALPGHGDDAVAVAPTWDANLDAIAATIGACDAVVGYSLGARVALGLVATGRVARGVLIGVNPGIDARERPERRTGDAVWATLLRTRGTAAFAHAWSALPLFATQARAPADRRAARRARRDRLDAEQLARSLEVMGLAAMPDYRDALVTHARAGTIALLAGADDAKYVALARALGVPLEVIADSGHDPTLEQPVALAAAIGRALDQIGSGELDVSNSARI